MIAISVRSRTCLTQVVNKDLWPNMTQPELSEITKLHQHRDKISICHWSHWTIEWIHLQPFYHHTLIGTMCFSRLIHKYLSGFHFQDMLCPIEHTQVGVTLCFYTLVCFAIFRVFIDVVNHIIRQLSQSILERPCINATCLGLQAS